MRLAGQATRERILAAAKKEFAERGPDGARINRIAAEANASKERLYAYFPSKEQLFAAVAEQLAVDVSAETALADDDIPAYAGRLFDSYARNPDNARLHDWLNFATRDLQDDSPQITSLKVKVDAIRRGQEAGRINSRWDPAQLLIIVIEIAKSMADPKDVSRHLFKANRRANTRAARRAATIEAIRLLCEA
jgi:AcrR family transcriptional regulator